MSEGSITRLINEANEGRPGAEDRLFNRVYTELQAIANARLARERETGDLPRSGELVNDAYARLSELEFQDRLHLFRTYAGCMRRILIDRARQRKRHPELRIATEPTAPQSADAALDAETVQRLVDRLREQDAALAEVVELRYFGGLSTPDIAEILRLSERTVTRRWTDASEHLRRWLADEE
ncbi:MAG: sigma-70 family RNA polymerase sigma factor [Phycisphaerales bacterium]|nr:sigma-70 family RNA polymerase sigma factor [Phycisphaerales bacterium]